MGYFAVKLVKQPAISINVGAASAAKSWLNRHFAAEAAPTDAMILLLEVR